jgi:hypothetical protein
MPSEKLNSPFKDAPKFSRKELNEMQVKELKELFEDDATFYKNTNNFRHYLP